MQLSEKIFDENNKMRLIYVIMMLFCEIVYGAFYVG